MTEETPPRIAFVKTRAEVIIDQHAHHPPQNEETVKAHELVRESTLQLSLVLEGLCPPGPEKEYALKAVREAMMWANSSIAIHGLGA